MSIQPFFKPNNKNNESMDIYVKSLSSQTLDVDNLELSNLEVEEITSKDYKFKDEDNNTYDNLNISYNTDINMYWDFTPNNPGLWWSLQLSASFLSIKRVPNNNLKIGSRFVLKCSLELSDPVNPNTVDFALKLGDTFISSSIFQTTPLQSSPSYVDLESYITVYDKTNNPKEYSFVISNNYIETTSNTTKAYTKNLKLDNITYNGSNSIIEYMFMNNGPSSFNTNIKRGNYTLNQIV